MQRSRPTLVLRSSLCKVQSALQIKSWSETKFTVLPCLLVRLVGRAYVTLNYMINIDKPWLLTKYIYIYIINAYMTCTFACLWWFHCFQDSEATRVLQRSNDQTFMVPEVLLGNHRFCIVPPWKIWVIDDKGTGSWWELSCSFKTQSHGAAWSICCNISGWLLQHPSLQC